MENTVDEDFTGTDDTETGALGALASLDNTAGTASDAQLMGVRDAMKRSRDLQLQQQAFYDRMARQLEQRRAGPSTSEQLFELSAALARPTTVRGFSGVLNNVMPVLQQQAKATREGKESRMEALNALQLAQLKGAESLAGRDLNTQIALAKITAAANKPPVGIDIGGVLTDPRTGKRIGGPAPGGIPAPRTVTVDGVTYLTDASGAPKTPVPQRGSFRPATPEEAAAYGARSGQINTATGEFKPVTQTPPTLSPIAQRELLETETAVQGGTSALQSLQEARALNNSAYEGSLSGARKAVGQLFASDSPEYRATEDLDNIIKTSALQSLKATFGANPTEGERKILLDLQASSSKTRAVREKILARAAEAVQQRVRSGTARLDRLKSGYYSAPGATAPAAPTTPSKVIRYDKTGKRI